ncbi:hypothetical protein JOF56_004970 [Kibdelosporangium banguiense]|uniref:Uncharacterized protein n=1 Tax=Kibdelosporangium banguiense TaxID=1365924 RepID=A0ABS4TJL3_9PSEU|nr:hypothetical protein [Kibdelosporangium banguiense]
MTPRSRSITRWTSQSRHRRRSHRRRSPHECAGGAGPVWAARNPSPSATAPSFTPPRPGVIRSGPAPEYDYAKPVSGSQHPQRMITRATPGMPSRFHCRSFGVGPIGHPLRMRAAHWNIRLRHLPSTRVVVADSRRPKPGPGQILPKPGPGQILEDQMNRLCGSSALRLRVCPAAHRSFSSRQPADQDPTCSE